MTDIIIIKTFIKSDRRQDIDFFNSKIVNLLLLYSPISIYNTFLFVIIYCLVHNSIKNMNIISTFKYIEVSNRQKKFINFFINNNIYTLINSTIFDIYNYLNNLIPEFFGQVKFW